MNLVIDTNIWVKGCTTFPYNADNIACDTFIMSFCSSNNSLTIDYDSRIEREYRGRLYDNEKFIALYHKLENEQRIVFNSSHISNSFRIELNKRGFHEEEDMIFLGTAFNSDKVIVTEDSDYGKGSNPKAREPEKIEVLRYITDHIHIDVFDSSEGVRLL